MVGMAVHALTVDSLDDPRLDDYRAIRDARLGEHDLFAVESREVVRRLLRERRYRLRSVLLTEPALATLDDLLEPTTLVYVAPHDVIREVVGLNFHRGCMGIAERGRPRTVADVLAAAPRTIVVCERVSNPDNVGGIFRDAMAFGVGAVILSPGCADPLARKVVRVSIGGSVSVPFAEATSWPDVLTHVRDAGYTIVALTSRDGQDVATLSRPERLALLLGNEGDGLTAAAMQHAAARATIRMAAGVDSLNVTVACGIALHRLG
jgi:tRNA G18 (ribose-2'-O)-methylase SpoU